jgi:hypothetical protein
MSSTTTSQETPLVDRADQLWPGGGTRDSLGARAQRASPDSADSNGASVSGHCFVVSACARVGD